MCQTLETNSFTQYLSSIGFKPEIKEKGGSIKATKSYERSITPLKYSLLHDFAEINKVCGFYFSNLQHRQSRLLFQIPPLSPYHHSLELLLLSLF